MPSFSEPVDGVRPLALSAVVMKLRRRRGRLLLPLVRGAAPLSPNRIDDPTDRAARDPRSARRDADEDLGLADGSRSSPPI